MGYPPIAPYIPCKNALGAAHDICGIEALGTLLAFKFDCFPLVQRPIPILLNGREVDEYIFSGGPLNEPISLGSIEPFHNAMFSHANPSPSNLQWFSLPLQMITRTTVPID